MGGRLSPKEQEQRRRTRLAAKLLFGAALVVGTLLTFWIRAFLRTVPIDQATMCPTDRPPVAQIVLLFDATDSFSEIQAAAARKELREIEKNIPKHARISVFALRAERNVGLEPITSLCNPGSGNDVNRWDGLPDKAKKLWRTRFNEPLYKLVEELLDERPATRSRILSEIQAISIVGFENTPGERRLYVLSDLLQHDETYSHYSKSSPPRFEDFKASGLLEKYGADLSGVSVYLLYVRRDGMESVQGRRHLLFWEQFFDAVGATVVAFTPLTG